MMRLLVDQSARTVDFAVMQMALHDGRYREVVRIDGKHGIVHVHQLYRDLGNSELTQAAARLNTRPYKTLDWEIPAERLAKLLATASCHRCCNHPLRGLLPAGSLTVVKVGGGPYGR